MIRHSSILIGLCFIIAVATLSCRQAIDIDIERKTIATNLPEITDFYPKAPSNYTYERLTIIGKNFFNIRQVLIDTLKLDSVVVESSERLSGSFSYRKRPFPQSYIANIPNGFLSIKVITQVGTAQSSDGFVNFIGYTAGKITENTTPLDSTGLDVIMTNGFGEKSRITLLSNNTITNPTEAQWLNRGFPLGWYMLTPISLNNNYGITELTIKPFKSGYRFTPTERTIKQGRMLVGGQDFSAKPIISNSLPLITDISPIIGNVYGWIDTGTTFTIRGLRFGLIEKVLLAVPPIFPSGNMQVMYLEGQNLIRTDSLIQFTLPGINKIPLPTRGTYNNCRIYFLLANGGSYSPEKRITIIYH